MSNVNIIFGYDCEYPNCSVFNQMLAERFYLKNYTVSNIIHSTRQSYTTIFIGVEVIEDLPHDEQNQIHSILNAAKDDYDQFCEENSNLHI